jgi:hypothetical protein
MPAKAAGRRNVKGRRVRFVTMICADFASLGMYLMLTSCRSSASKRSGTPDAEADAEVALADSAAVRVRQGASEGSNVSAAQAMVQMIAQNRLFDLNIRLVQAAEQNSKTAGALMSLSRA